MPLGAASVLLNDNIHAPELQRGVDRCFAHVVAAVEERFASDAILCSPRGDAFGGRLSRLRLPATFTRHRRLQSLAVSLAARVHRARLVFSPYFGRLHTSSIEIYMVYDMIYELFPQYFSPKDSGIASFVAEKRRCFERATTLVAISESTARDVSRVYSHIDPAKIHVIYPGVDDEFSLVTPRQVETPGDPYFLYVGNRWLYKNFIGFVEAFGHSGLLGEWELRVVSPIESPWTEAEQRLFARLGLTTRVRLLSNVSDVALRELYARATALVYPSEYEGFGLPVLEAMACGTVVAAARAASIPEAGGDVALYFDPVRTDEIAECLRRVAYMETAERKMRVEAGRVRARQFTWKRFGEQTAELLSNELAE